jgi:multidrug efflux pump subunit AcrB
MLWALGMTFNIFSFIGLIMLLGMATKNAILLVDYANRMKRDADSIVDAAKRAAHVRFRPVLMTTFSTVLGIMPIAMGFGAGGRARAPLGVAVASGLLATTLLTLIVVPVVYTYFERLQNAIMRATRAEGGTQKGSAPAAAGARQ